MTIVKRLCSMVFFSLFIFMAFTQPQQVFANAVCDLTGPPCVMEYIPYTYLYCKPVYSTTAPYGQIGEDCTEQTEIVERCTIPQSGGGSCQCCYNDGCYLDCAVIQPTGGGGGGDGEGDGEGEVAPLGSTSTPVPTSTPIALGTIQARAVQVTADDTSCTAIRAVPTTAGQINNTILQFTPSSASAPPAQLQSGANYVTFANILTGWYTGSHFSSGYGCGE